MQFHSIEDWERDNEFQRVLSLASQGTQEVLIVSPDRKGSLVRHLQIFFGGNLANQLTSKRNITFNGINYFYEFPRSGKSNFKQGNIFLPWAAESTWQQFIPDTRGINTYFIPWIGNKHVQHDPKLFTTNELTLYLQQYPGSIQI